MDENDCQKVRWNELVKDLVTFTNVKDLAERIRVTDKEVRRWMRGEVRPQGSHARDLLRECDEFHINWNRYTKITPVYDLRGPFDENLNDGPQGLPSRVGWLPTVATNILGKQLNSPVGIPASVLTINSKWIAPLAKLGFDLLTYKTCRTKKVAAHPFPNIAYLPEVAGPWALGTFPSSAKGALSPSTDDLSKISLANSFGMPSPDPKEWQEDVRITLNLLQPGQMLIASVVGTVSPDDDDLVGDFVKCARMAHETGAHAVELNFSCPNVYERVEGSVYHDPVTARRIVERVRSELHSARILIKIGHLKAAKLAEIFNATYRHVDGFTAINTMLVEVRSDGRLNEPVFPGSKRLKAGVSGAAIRDYALEAVRSLRKLASQKKPDLVILGTGGISSPADAKLFLDTGANGIQICTAALFNPLIGAEIRKHLANGEAARTRSRYLDRVNSRITFSDPIIRDAFDSTMEACEELRVPLDKAWPVLERRWLSVYRSEVEAVNARPGSPVKTRRSAPDKIQILRWLRDDLEKQQ